MNDLAELHVITASTAVWHRYDASVKAELWSSAIRTSAGVYIVDPIRIHPGSLAESFGDCAILAIIVTNENHVRDASFFGLPVFARFRCAIADTQTSEFDIAELQVIDLPGAPNGEIAIVTATGELVIGDALINFEPFGFTFLPEKYCTDAKQMRQSLRKLLDYNFERLLFAHGTPITRNAHRRLELLLADA